MSNPVATVGLLNQFVLRAQQLYTLPAVAMKVLELTQQDALDTRALKACIERDPALCGKLLRVVNSSLFGLSTPIADLHQALTLLGTKPLKVLVLGFSLPPNLVTGLEANVLQNYWRHTLIKGTAARELSRRVWKQSGDEAFLAGLLQDVGQLVLIQQLDDVYVGFLDKVQREQRQLSCMERATLGFAHTELSQMLLEAWNLPSQVTSAIGQPADTDRLLSLPADQQQLPQILHLAELIATLLTCRDPAALQELLEAGRRYQDISTDELQKLIDDLVAMVPQLAEVLSIKLPESDYIAVLREAQERLSQASEEVLMGGAPDALQGEPEMLRLSAALRKWEHPDEPSIALDATGSDAPVATLTGDPALEGRLAAAVAACRLARNSLSLLLLEIDGFHQLALTFGTDSAGMLVERLRKGVGCLDQSPMSCLEVADGRLAVVLPGCERSRALELGRQLLAEVPGWLGQRVTGDPTAVVTLSAGLASVTLPPRNFPVDELIEAAERCLYGAQTSGGVIKSIDV